MWKESEAPFLLFTYYYYDHHQRFFPSKNVCQYPHARLAPESKYAGTGRRATWQIWQYASIVCRYVYWLKYINIIVIIIIFTAGIAQSL
jgi:hypothetical protein